MHSGVAFSFEFFGVYFFTPFRASKQACKRSFVVFISTERQELTNAQPREWQTPEGREHESAGTRAHSTHPRSTSDLVRELPVRGRT